MDAPLAQMSTEALKSLRDSLHAERRAKVKAGKPLPLYEHADTQDVLRMAGELEDFLFTFKVLVGQWLTNMDRIGAERMAQQAKRPRLAPTEAERLSATETPRR
jgi:hypothetical protein